MSIFTAVGIQGGRPSLKFLERDLHLAPATVQDCGILPIPRPKPSVQYRTTIDWIHLYGAAIIDKKIYMMNPPLYNILKRISDTLPVLTPILAIKLSSLPDLDKSDLGSWGMVESPQAKGTIWLGRPTLANFRNLVEKFGMPTDPVPAGNVNATGYYAFHMAWKAVGLFTIVSSSVTNNPDIMFAGIPTQTFAVKKGVQVEIAAGLNQRVEVSGAGDSPIEVFSYPSLRPIFSPMKQFATRNDYTWSLNESLGGGEGFIFPYFHGLLLPDRDYLGTTFFRYFSSCIVDTETDFPRVASSLRRGFRSLQATKGGMELQHIFFGIDLACSLGGSIRVLMEGRQYMGFVLVKVNGVILEKNSIRTPMPAEELKAARLALSVHTNALNTVKGIVEKYPMMTGEEEEFSIEDYRSSSRKLANHLMQRDFSGMEPAERSELTETLDKLVFDETFWEPTASNMLIVLKAMTTGLWHYPEAPYYHGKGCGLSLNQFVRALAVFGPDVPDIFLGNESRSISKPGRDDPNLVQKDGKRERLPYIPVYSQPILAAAGHWRAVQNQSQIRFFAARNGKREFTDRKKVRFDISGEQFEPFYTLLREFVEGKDKDKPSVDRKGKRKATEGDIDMSGSTGGSETGKRAKLDTMSGGLF